MGFLRRRRGPDRKTVIRTPSENRYIKKVSARILSQLEAAAVPEERIFDIKLCVEEAVRNAIVHGNRSDRNKTVITTFTLQDDRVTIEVEDEGEGYDHTTLPDPTDADYIMRNSGRGVYLIRKLMDSITFNDRGNKIVMAKKVR